MTDVHPEVQEGSFSVSGFNLTKYRKKKPDVYRYVICIHSFFTYRNLKF